MDGGLRNRSGNGRTRFGIERSCRQAPESLLLGYSFVSEVRELDCNDKRQSLFPFHGFSPRLHRASATSSSSNVLTACRAAVTLVSPRQSPPPQQSEKPASRYVTLIRPDSNSCATHRVLATSESVLGGLMQHNIGPNSWAKARNGVLFSCCVRVKSVQRFHRGGRMSPHASGLGGSLALPAGV